MSFRLSVLRVFALDWQAAVDFYADTLQLPVRFSNSDAGWAEFDVGETSLAVERIQPEDAAEEALTGRFLGASLEVTDLGETYGTLLDRGVTFIAPPQRQPWGGSLAHFKDPEGNVLTLLERP